MARQGKGFWIDGDTGKIAEVRRHESWLKNTNNLKAFGKLDIAPEIKKYVGGNPDTDADAIRFLGLQAGLVRVRDNGGVLSIQFYAARGRVSDILYNTATALKSVGEYGVSVWINNLYYDDSVNVPWDKFIRKTNAGEPLLIHEDKLPAVDDIKPNPALMKKLAKQLRDVGIDPNKGYE